MDKVVESANTTNIFEVTDVGSESKAKVLGGIK